MSSNNDHEIVILHNSIIYLHQFVLPIFYVLGNIGNLLTALIFTKKSWRKNVCVFYFNLFLISSTLYINIVVLSDILTGFDIRPSNFNSILCKITVYIISLLSSLLPSLLILASIDRLLISSQNIDARLYSSKRLAYFSVSLNTLFWIIFYIHLLVKTDTVEMTPSHFTCYHDLSEWYLRFVTYSSLIIYCLLSLTMIILCLCTFKNVRHIRAIPRQKRHEIRMMTKKDFQLLRCLFLHDIIYIIFTIGYSIYIVYEGATIHQRRPSLQQEIVDFINHFNEFLHHIPFCVSFYIYIIVSKAFRNAVKRIIYQICRKDVSSIHEEENAVKDNRELNIVVVNPID